MPSLAIATNTDGTTLVAAPTSAKNFIRVKGLDITGADAVTVSLLSNTTVIWSTSAAGNSGQAGGIVLNLADGRTLDCAGGEALKIGLSASVAVKGSIEYIILGPPS